MWGWEVSTGVCVTAEGSHCGSLLPSDEGGQQGDLECEAPHIPNPIGVVVGQVPHKRTTDPLNESDPPGGHYPDFRDESPPPESSQSSGEETRNVSM